MNKNIHEYVKELFWQYGKYLPNGSGLIPSKVPFSYSDIPKIKSVKGHRNMSIKDIMAYFQRLLFKNKHVIAVINGVPTDSSIVMTLQCMMCHETLEKLAYHEYLYCYTSHCVMCQRCMGDDRQCTCSNDLENTHHVIEQRHLVHRNVVCDMCHNPILSDTFLTIQPSNLEEEDTVLLCKNCMWYDVVCKKRMDGEAVSQEVKNPLLTYYNEMQFGSILDWVPLLTDVIGCYVLVNLNTMSEFHWRICLACPDRNGSYGYYVLPKSVLLSDVLKELNELTKAKAWKKCRKEDRFTNYPIKQLMIARNMLIHFVTFKPPVDNNN